MARRVRRRTGRIQQRAHLMGLGMRLLNPEIAHPFVAKLFAHLALYGVMDTVEEKGYISILAHFAALWTQEETSLFLTLWYMLGKPKIREYIDRDRWGDLMSEPYIQYFEATRLPEIRRVIRIREY
jgi:hypothetical protein